MARATKTETPISIADGMAMLAALHFSLVLTCAQLGAQASAPSSQPVDVSVCDLLGEPAKYNGAIVRVRGRVSLAFEDFTLHGGECAPPSGGSSVLGVWLSYGGDENTPAIYCCGDHSRKPGEVIKFHGKSVPLLRDAHFQEFRKRISAERQVRTDGLPCYERECYFYDVNATLTGHFLPLQETESGGWSGYGHFGRFHTLVIEQVTDVEASRTAVPAGGVFDCKSEVWDVPLSEASDLVSNYQSCSESKSCEKAQRDALAFGTRHWEESAEKLTGWHQSDRGEAEFSWSSPDLRSTYNLKFPYTNPYIKRVRTKFIITRTVCSETTTPLPQSVKVSCQRFDWNSENPKTAGRGLQETPGVGPQERGPDLATAGWMAIQEFAQKRGVLLSPHLVLDKCDPFETDSDQSGNCRWISKDGLQEAAATMIRTGFLRAGRRQKRHAAWVLTGISLTNCKPD